LRDAGLQNGRLSDNPDDGRVLHRNAGSIGSTEGTGRSASKSASGGGGEWLASSGGDLGGDGVEPSVQKLSVRTG